MEKTIESEGLLETLSKPSPCDGCQQYLACKNRLLACKQFFAYVHSGRILHGVKVPTRKIWQRIFVEDTDDEKVSIKKYYKELT